MKIFCANGLIKFQNLIVTDEKFWIRKEWNYSFNIMELELWNYLWTGLFKSIVNIYSLRDRFIRWYSVDKEVGTNSII